MFAAGVAMSAVNVWRGISSAAFDDDGRGRGEDGRSSASVAR